MNCRTFTRLTADWLAGQLEPAQERRMADHRRACESCARLAEREESLRAAWRAAPEAIAPDLWPRLAARLGDNLPAAPVRNRRPTAWVFGAGLVAAMAAAGGLWIHLEATPMSPGPTGTGVAIIAPQSRPTGQAHVSTAAWLATSDIAQVNPAIDDPAGISMEHIWTQINSTNSDQSDGE